MRRVLHILRYISLKLYWFFFLWVVAATFWSKETLYEACMSGNETKVTLTDIIKIWFYYQALFLLKYRTKVWSVLILWSWVYQTKGLVKFKKAWFSKGTWPYAWFFTQIISCLWVALCGLGTIIPPFVINPLPCAICLGLLLVSMQVFLLIEKLPKLSASGEKLSIELKKGWLRTLSIVNPQEGIFIVGGPGSGKTKYLIEPILHQMIKNEYCGLIYDYDFGTTANAKTYCLSELAYNCVQKYAAKNTSFACLNFADLTRSVRVNPLAPEYIQDRVFLNEYVKIIFNNLGTRKDDFWEKNTVALLTSIFVFLSNKHPDKCSLPHAILLGMQPVDKLVSLLSSDKEASLYASAFFDSQKAPEQMAGIITSFKVSMQPLLDKTIFWVLSENQIDLKLNDSTRPTILSIGNIPSKSTALAPIIALIVSVVNSNLYGHGRKPCFLTLDELPTLYLPQLAKVPATARKYKISTIVAIQNDAQLVNKYRSAGANELKESFQNAFVGKTKEVGTADNISKVFGSEIAQTTSQTTSMRGGNSTTISERDKLIVQNRDIINLTTGQFVGVRSGNQEATFKTKLKPIWSYFDVRKLAQLPVVNQEADIEANFHKIEQDIQEICSLFRKEVDIRPFKYDQKEFNMVTAD